MQNPSLAPVISGCSTISRRAVSAATEIEQLRNRTLSDDTSIRKLGFLATKLQQFRQHVDNLQQCLEDATVISDRLREVAGRCVGQCDSATTVLQKQVMRVQPQNLGQLDRDAVAIFQDLLVKSSRVFILVAQLLSVPSAESQDTKLDHTDAADLVSLAEESTQKVLGGVDILAGPPTSPNPEVPNPEFASSSTAAVPELNSVDSSRSKTASSPRARTRGLSKGLSSLTNTFKAMAAGMRPKPEAFVSALCQAASRGNALVIKGLLKQGANIDGRNEDGNTALIAAILAYQPDTAIFLLEAGADKSVRSSSGKRRPPLYHAIHVGDLKTAQYLLDHGANVNERNLVGQSYFIDVIQSENLDLIQLLLRHGADVNAREITGRSIIAWAVCKGNLELVRILLAHGADPNARDITGHPIICTASSKDQTNLLQLLLSSGADPNSRHITGPTLLVDAVQRGRTDLVKALLSAGANPNEKDIMGTSVLLSTIRHTALSETDKEVLINLLLSHGADPNVADSWGLTGLAHAAAANNLPLFKAFLFAPGADPNQFVHADTLLVHAIDQQKREQARLLLEHRADPNKADKLGRTPLLAALQKMDVDMVRLLIEKGANVKQNAGYLSLIAVAKATGREDLVRLIEHGSGEAGMNGTGRSPTGTQAMTSRCHSPPPGYRP